MVLAGCLDPGDTGSGPESLEDGAYTISRGWSQPLSPALYDILPGDLEWVASFDGTEISLGLFFPDNGCDWEAAELPEECRLPVVLSANPYFGPTIGDPSVRPPLVEWLVPRGYIVVQMALRGTGFSGGCMEFGSLNEQRDVDEILNWLGEAPWSTGDVGMMGRSYVGTTPWYGAAFGNPYLKTIVPIHGITDWAELMFKNGTSETRGPYLHTFFTYNYGLGLGDGGPPEGRAEHWNDQIECEETVKGLIHGPLTKALADASDPYWQERAMRERILDNYNGSVWIIQGLHDWNVNPSQQVPMINALQDNGNKVKAWLGVWQHHYPDRRDEHANPRWDWADTIVRWFDSELKGLDVDTGPVIEVQDNLMVWRSEESYPPRDVEWKVLETDISRAIVASGNGTSGDFILTGSPNAAPCRAMTIVNTWVNMLTGHVPSPVSTPSGSCPTGHLHAHTDDIGTSASFTSTPLEEALRIAGFTRYHVTVTPSTPAGGSLFAELYDVWPDGRTQRIGWGAIDVRNHAGGYTNDGPLTPGEPVLVKMEFEPMDAIVTEGHRLRLVVHKNGVETVDPSLTADPLLLGLGAERSLLKLPVIERPHVIESYSQPKIIELD
jgi:predicted acyl esterase